MIPDLGIERSEGLLTRVTREFIRGNQMNKPVQSPYLDFKRLADVIAAIQFLGIYKFYKLKVEDWTDRIGVDPESAQEWMTIFKEHPEFFRVGSSEKKVSLVWRRAYQKRFDVDTERLITREEYRSRDTKAQSRVTRAPLEDAQITTLVRTAIDLHDRAMAHRREARWWIPIAAGFLGIALGAFLKPLFSG